MPMDEKLLTMDEIAKRFNVTLRTVYNWVHATPPKLNAIKIGGKWLVQERELYRRLSIKTRDGSPAAIIEKNIIVEFHGACKLPKKSEGHRWTFLIRGEQPKSIPFITRADETTVIICNVLMFASKLSCVESLRTELQQLLQNPYVFTDSTRSLKVKAKLPSSDVTPDGKESDVTDDLGNATLRQWKKTFQFRNVAIPIPRITSTLRIFANLIGAFVVELLQTGHGFVEIDLLQLRNEVSHQWGVVASLNSGRRIELLKSEIQLSTETFEENKK
jgi:excisionase family DNA binding protein